MNNIYNPSNPNEENANNESVNRVIEVIVDNEFGALARVVSLFSGLLIESPSKNDEINIIELENKENEKRFDVQELTNQIELQNTEAEKIRLVILELNQAEKTTSSKIDELSEDINEKVEGLKQIENIFSYR